MFIPNRYAKLSRQGPKNFDNERPYKPAITVACAVVHLNKKSVPTSVRADSSASRGNARELTLYSKLLFPTAIVLEVNDKVEVDGYVLKCIHIEPRYAVSGQLDHYECDFERY